MSNQHGIAPGCAARAHFMQRRRELFVSTVLGGGIMALASLTASPAAAQNECGSAPLGGTVTCTPAGNNYSNGITYVAVANPLTVVLQNGVNINTTGGIRPGVQLTGVGNASFVLQGLGATVTTDANNASGVFATTDTGNINLGIGSVTTSGTNASGVRAASAAGNIAVNATTVRTSGAGSNGVDASTPLGDINVNAGSIATTGTNANGVLATTNRGNISVAPASVNTTGAGAAGVRATSTLGNIVIGNGASVITTSGVGADAVNAATGTGAISVNVQQARTTGATSDAIDLTSASGAVTVNARDVTTTGNGSRGVVASGESVAVNLTGGANGTTGPNANAIEVRARNGAASVTTGAVSTVGDSSAVIDVSSLRGPVTVQAGALTTSGANSVGIRASTGTGGSAVPGDTAAVGGPINVNVTSIRTGGANSTGLITNALFGADTTINAGDIQTTGAGSSGILATSGMGGDIRITAGRVTATGAGSNAIQAAGMGASLLVVNTTGLVSSTQGTGILVNSGSTSTINVGSGSNVSGAVNGINSTAVGGTVITNAGVIGSTGGFAVDANGGAASITNTGTVNGRIDLTANADTVTNAAGARFNAVGTSDFGLGADAFNNAGVLTAFSSATFNGLENFTNTGLVDLRDGVADDILTLTGTTFTGGPGSQVGLDVTFANNASDRLIIGTAAGTTTLLLNNTAPGTAPLLNLNGILVVDANTAAASNFQLGGISDFGFTRLNLVFDAATNNFLLVTAPDTEVFEAGRYGVGMGNAWNQSGDAWSARMTELRDVAFTGLEARPDGFEMWAQGYAGSEGQNQVRSFNLGGPATTFDLSYDQEFQGFQLGGDVKSSMGWATTVFGLTGGVINSDQTFASGNSFRLQGGNIGAYAGLYAGGFFLNGLVKADRYDATVMSSTAFFREETQATTLGAKAEAGYRMGLGGFFIEPLVTLAYTDSDMDDLSVPGGTFTFEDNESLRGEAGVRVGGDFAMGSSRIQPFIGVFAVEEYRGQNTAVFNSGPTAFRLQDVEPDGYGKVSVGLNLLEQDGVNLFIRGDALFGGEADGGSVRIGARWSF